MNKYLTWLPVFMLLAFVVNKPAKEAMKSELVNENISFAVYKSHPYKSDVYDNTSAQVKIVVEKINTSGQHTIVWEKTMDAESLSKYPTAENALKQNVIVHNINEKKEYLVVDYTLIYNSKGSELQMHDAEIVKDNNSGKINISI
jgi:hypothetical protein